MKLGLNFKVFVLDQIKMLKVLAILVILQSKHLTFFLTKTKVLSWLSIWFDCKVFSCQARFCPCSQVGLPPNFLRQCKDDGSFDTYECGGGHCRCNIVPVPPNYLANCFYDGTFDSYPCWVQSCSITIPIVFNYSVGTLLQIWWGCLELLFV